jgi:hypothetical protein
MRSIILNVLAGLSVLNGVFAIPLSTPTFGTDLINPTSFPALTDNSKIPQLQVLAHGTLPNGPPPPPKGISAEGITSLQLIELNEFFEAAFFTSLLLNITNNVPGFEIHDQDEKIYIEDALIAIIAVSLGNSHNFPNLYLTFSTARAAPRHRS